MHGVVEQHGRIECRAAAYIPEVVRVAGGCCVDDRYVCSTTKHQTPVALLWGQTDREEVDKGRAMIACS